MEIIGSNLPAAAANSLTSVCDFEVWTRAAGGLIVQMWRLPDWQEGKCCQSAVAAARHEEEADGTR
jgi:hypothetical protein